MNLRTYIITLSIATAAAVAAWIVTIKYINPDISGLFGVILFFASFFIGLTGVGALLGLYVRILFSKNEVLFAAILPSFRQGVLLATCATLLLFLQSLQLFRWWDALIVIIIISLIEFFFHSKELQQSQKQSKNQQAT